MAQFTRDNTEGYSDHDLSVLNARFEDDVYLPPEALERFTDQEVVDWRQHVSEHVLADFNAKQS